MVLPLELHSCLFRVKLYVFLVCLLLGSCRVMLEGQNEVNIAIILIHVLSSLKVFLSMPFPSTPTPFIPFSSQSA